MERTEEFELACKEAELLKAMPHGGIVARQFLLLVEENKKLEFVNSSRKSTILFLGGLSIVFQLMLLANLLLK